MYIISTYYIYLLNNSRILCFQNDCKQLHLGLLQSRWFPERRTHGFFHGLTTSF